HTHRLCPRLHEEGRNPVTVFHISQHTGSRHEIDRGKTAVRPDAVNLHRSLHEKQKFPQRRIGGGDNLSLREAPGPEGQIPSVKCVPDMFRFHPRVNLRSVLYLPHPSALLFLHCATWHRKKQSFPLY